MPIHARGPLYLLFLCWIVLSQCLEGMIPCGHLGLITSSDSPSRRTFSKVGSSWSFSIRSKVKVVQLCPALCSPVDYIVHGILQARILKWVAFPFSRDLPNPGIEPRSPAVQTDSLPAEPQRKPFLSENPVKFFLN